jgi:hypothetical protein
VIALLVSLDSLVRLDYSAPKFWGLVLGPAMRCAVVNAFRPSAHFRLAEGGLLLVGAVLAALGESLGGRVELWQRGIVMAVDVPFVGRLAAVRAHLHAPLVNGELLAAGAQAHFIAESASVVPPSFAQPPIAGSHLAPVQLPSPSAQPAFAVTRPRSRWVVLGITVVLTPIVAPAESLNAATLLFHRGLGTASPFLDEDLQLAQTLAIVDPLAARVYAARALLAHQGSDTPNQREFLDRAAATGGAWDPSLALRLGDMHFAAADRPGAIAAWRSAGALPVLLDRAANAPPEKALDWYSRSQSVDPADWRPYAGAGRLLESLDPNRAATLVSQALRLRANDPARAALARRLLDPVSPLPATVTIDASPNDADMLLLSSRLLEARSDLAAAVYAAQLSTQAAPTWPATWQRLATLLDKLGRPTQADDARARAQRLIQ